MKHIILKGDKEVRLTLNSAVTTGSVSYTTHYYDSLEANIGEDSTFGELAFGSTTVVDAPDGIRVVTEISVYNGTTDVQSVMIDVFDGTDTYTVVNRKLLQPGVTMLLSESGVATNGGGVDSVSGGDGISVDNSDESNPVVNLSANLSDLEDIPSYPTDTENIYVLVYFSGILDWMPYGGGGGSSWGDIDGNIENQADLQAQFAEKYDASNPAGYITDSALVPLENRITENEADILALQNAATENVIQSIIIACSDEDSDLELSTTEFRVPYAFTLTDVRASVGTAPTGSEIIVDINQNGTSILSTKLTIDDGEKISTTAEVPPVISTTALGDFNEITIDIDQIGSTVAGAGLKVYLIGYKTP